MSFLEQPGFADDVRSVLTDLLGLPPAFMDYTVQYNALNGLPIPVSQLTGFSQFTVNSATVVTLESTTSLTYTDLATPGPTLSGLAAGHYVILVGAVARDAGGNGAFIAPSTGADAEGGETQSTGFSSIIGVSVHSFSSSSSSVSAKYRTNGGTSCSFLNRWILALKYANL